MIGIKNDIKKYINLNKMKIDHEDPLDYLLEKSDEIFWSWQNSDAVLLKLEF